MKKALIDTNIISAFMRGNGRVQQKFEEYLQEYNTLTISIITYYEIIRGIKALSSKSKTAAFHEFISLCEIQDFEVSVAKKAAEIYDTLRREGNLLEDADIIIAATAISKNMLMVTDNVRHFSRIKELDVENWLK